MLSFESDARFPGTKHVFAARHPEVPRGTQRVVAESALCISWGAGLGARENGTW